MIKAKALARLQKRKEAIATATQGGPDVTAMATQGNHALASNQAVSPVPEETQETSENILNPSST